MRDAASGTGCNMAVSSKTARNDGKPLKKDGRKRIVTTCKAETTDLALFVHRYVVVVHW